MQTKYSTIVLQRWVRKQRIFIGNIDRQAEREGEFNSLKPRFDMLPKISH